MPRFNRGAVSCMARRNLKAKVLGRPSTFLRVLRFGWASVSSARLVFQFPFTNRVAERFPPFSCTMMV